MTILEVDDWSKMVAKEYLTTGKSLNTSIEKIASERGLNRDQISRVVEAANTEVYVQMFNQAKDKYIQFDSADSEKIAEHIFGTEKTSHVSDTDYQEPPTYSYPIEDSAAESMLTKVAEVTPTNVTDTEALHGYYKIAALETRLQQSMDEVEVSYQHDSSILYSMIKQAVLSGTSFGDIQKALFGVYDESIIKVNLNEVQEKLAQELYPRKLNMSSNSVGTINMDNPLVKQAGLLLKHAQEFKTLKSKHAETMEALTTHIKESGVLKPLLAGIGIGGIGGTAVVDQAQKAKQKRQVIRTEMQQLPNAYAR